MAYECKTCEDSKFIDGEGNPFSRIEAKDGKRPAWVGLAARTPKLACPSCYGGGVKQAAPKAEANPKRKYTKRSPRWGTPK